MGRYRIRDLDIPDRDAMAASQWQRAHIRKATTWRSRPNYRVVCDGCGKTHTPPACKTGVAGLKK